jgi:guanine deaminase
MVEKSSTDNHLDSTEHSRLIGRAIQLAVENVKQGGGPFGALIVRDGEIIGEGANQVTIDCDPTAHAEIIALRAACKREKQFHLDGCAIYTSCEPCPMCLSAAYWAHISTIYYAAAADSAAKAGFADAFIYEQFKLPREKRDIALIKVAHTDAEKAFQNWNANAARVDY